METYRVRVARGDIGFAAAHFLVFSSGECERLHGHNYAVGVEVSGPLDASGLVYDFVVLKRMLREITRSVDHRTLLPARSPRLSVEERGEGVQASAGEKRWLFPRDDCRLLPVANVTAEEIAAWIAARLLEEMAGAGFRRPDVIEVEVEEEPGQAAIYRME